MQPISGRSTLILFLMIYYSLCRSDLTPPLSHDTSRQLFMDLTTYYLVSLLSEQMTASPDNLGQRLCLIHRDLHRANSRSGHLGFISVTWTSPVPTLSLDLLISKQMGGDDL